MFLGAFHLFPVDQTPAPKMAAAHELILGEAGSTQEDSVVQSVGEEYFAVLVVLLLGLFLGPLLRRTGPWYGCAAPRTCSGLRTRLRGAHPARGPVGPLLQVFRL